VLLRVQVQADGRVARVVVARSSGFEVLDAAARSAIEQWKFLPAQRDGTPVPAWVELPVRFELRG
jgi:protein TonB